MTELLDHAVDAGPSVGLSGRWRNFEERTRRWASSGAGFASIALWTALALVVVLNSPGVFVPDIKPEVYLQPWASVGLFAMPWQVSPQLGWANFNVGLAPVPLAVAAIQLLGVDPEFSVRVVRLLLLTIAAAGAARLICVVGPGRDRPWVRLAAAVLIVANPYTVVGGSTLAVLLPMAFLPWFLIAVIKSIWQGGWRWPAVAALVFAAMSGMNVGVIPLLQLVSVPFLAWFAVRDRGLAVRTGVRALLRIAVLVIAVSLYWIVPSLSGAAFGVSVVQNSETLDGIHAISSIAEVVRGLGMWSMYGSDTQGPWQPGFVSYLTSPLVVVATFGFFVAVLWSLGRIPRSIARPFGAMAVTAAVLMMGLYPIDHPAPMASALRWVFTEFPVSGAFRTLNKLGAVLVIAGVILVTSALSTLAPRTWSVPRRVCTVLAVVAVLSASVWPALSGGLYPRELPIPDYWKQAAAAVDARNTDSRVWLIPGEVQGDYTWSTSQPDDLALPLFTRRSLLRTVLPTASPSAANLLAGIDSRLQAGELFPGTLSSFARRLSVGDLVVRNDSQWLPPLGARPWVVRGQIAGDTGLGKEQAWGTPGENIENGGGLEQFGDQSLPPVQAFPVVSPLPFIRAESLRGALLVAGDGASLSAVYEAGLMPQDQSHLYLGDLSERQFADLLGPERRIVLTDGNRRINVSPARLTQGQSALLPASQELESSRALGTADDQTVLQVEGGSVSVTPVQSIGAPIAWGTPEKAFDGNRRTSWQFGGFEQVVGTSLTASFPEPLDVGTISITQVSTGPVSIDSVVVAAGNQTVEAKLRPDGTTRIPLDASNASSLTVTVKSTQGSGLNLVAISEITIPGFQLSRVARLPDRLDLMASQLDASGWLALAGTPIDVVLRRESTGSWNSSEEDGLLRDFSLPLDRSFRVYGLARVPPATLDADGCFPLAQIDGQPVRARVLGPSASPYASLVAGCDPLMLLQGKHQIRPAPGAVVDRLTLRDSLGEKVVSPGPVPAVTFSEQPGPRYGVSVANTPVPVLLVAAEAADPRWNWSGPTLTPRTMIVDGGLNGWILPAGSATSGVIAFGPQSRDVVAMTISALVVLGCLVLAVPLVFGRFRRRDPDVVVASSRAFSVWALVIPVVVLFLALGTVPALAGGVAVVWWLRERSWRRLVSASVLLGVCVPVVWLLGARDIFGTVSGALVTTNAWPNVVAGAALSVALIAQVVRGRHDPHVPQEVAP
ncbi:MAG: alpha-(1-_3)-arabinofuranosyltransferase family protein [Actinobacteria bacterium]|nr:alpha-(1->3)-arabinofuranosyltransferase family protein [Actinomycetota bacterium]